MRWAFTCLLLFFFPDAAQAGAWTREAGSWQLITGSTTSRANETFGTTAPISFRRTLFQSYTEYGWKPRLTLFLATETASVNVTQNGGAPFHATDNAVQAGARWRFDRTIGLGEPHILSMEMSYRSAGAFNFAVSANRNAGGSGYQLRLLYGRSFKLGRRDAFVDVALGQEFLSGNRAMQTPLDITAGWWVGTNHLAMVQSFNLFAPKGRIPAYPDFRSHKLQASWVYRWRPKTLLQLGVFVSPSGHNALKEEGLALSLWRRF